MSMHTRVASTLAIGAALICSVSVQAADNTRYISITGDNANPCTLAKPCRSLQFAIGITPAGGEIQILDSGFYGNNATIKKSLTISGNGNTVYLGNILTIDKADAVVALRGLVLNGQGTIVDGIQVTAAATVHIERCVIHGFTQSGILATAAGVEVFVLDSISRDNGFLGLLVTNTGASRLTIDNSRFENNLTGVSVQSGRAMISRSIASGNGQHGITAFNTDVSVMATMAAQNGLVGFLSGGAGSGSKMTMESSVAHGNGTRGLVVESGGIARISNSTFTSNAVGILNTGTVETRQNNIVRGNGTNVSGALTPIGGV